MESSAFPERIKMKLMKLKFKKLMNVFISPKIMQKCSKQYFFSLETLGICPFLLIATQREMHQSKIDQRKNLAQDIYYKDTQVSL